jgi:hypothetical protein
VRLPNGARVAGMGQSPGWTLEVRLLDVFSDGTYAPTLSQAIFFSSPA